MIYGPFGLLPIARWEECFHPVLWSRLRLEKLGRLEGISDDEQLVHLVNELAAQHGIPPLPRLIVVGVRNHFSKASTFNSGDGPTVWRAALRKAVKIPGILRLNERWLVLAIELPVQPIDSLGHPLGKTCFVVIVFDCATQCPVGCWATTEPVKSAHLGLAQYQSIFHPGALAWPLRGFPETTVVPAALAKLGIEHLRQSAALLGTKVEVARHLEVEMTRLPQVKQLTKDLKQAFTPAMLPGRRRAAPRQMTARELQDHVLSWLYDRCFSAHRCDDVPPDLQKHGIALPGFDTPIAGVLLPVTGTVRTIHNGVRDGPFRYTSAVFTSEPGLELRKREFPYHYDGMKRSVFVDGGPGTVPHYLTYHPS